MAFSLRVLSIERRFADACTVHRVGNGRDQHSGAYDNTSASALLGSSVLGCVMCGLGVMATVIITAMVAVGVVKSKSGMEAHPVSGVIGAETT
jgi:hypothetical protein